MTNIGRLRINKMSLTFSKYEFDIQTATNLILPGPSSWIQECSAVTCRIAAFWSMASEQLKVITVSEGPNESPQHAASMTTMIQ